MFTVSTDPVAVHASFHTVAESFLQGEGLPFANVLGAESIEATFRRLDAVFAEKDKFNTPIVLWAFLQQVLSSKQQAACSSAVANICKWAECIGASVPSGDTGDYCRARAKLNVDALRELTRHTADGLDAGAPDDWLQVGRPVKLVDGFTFTMPDTPANQQAFPQAPTQEPGIGFPIARAVAVLSLTTASIHDLAMGSYLGKETGETALLRDIYDALDPGDIAVFDRCYGSYMTLAQLALRHVDSCSRLHQRRVVDFSKGRRLGPGDYLMTWNRPERPAWMTPEEYERIPQTMEVRMVELLVTDEARRVERLTIVTTLTDHEKYPPSLIAKIYGYRWCAELDIFAIKTQINLDHVRCKSPEMVEREVWVTLLAYNLIRRVAAAAALRHGKQPRRMSFTLTCQELLAAWVVLAVGVAQHDAIVNGTLKRIARHEVPHRPGRIEPRVVKRRPKPYKLMQKPRAKWRAERRSGAIAAT